MGVMHAATATAEQVVGAMEADGYCVVEGLLDEAAVAAARSSLRDALAATPHGRNSFEGFETTRVYALFARPGLRRRRRPPARPRRPRSGAGPLPASAPAGIQIGPGEQAQVLTATSPVSTPAAGLPIGGGEHDVGPR
jgi:hypothetical protein